MFVAFSGGFLEDLLGGSPLGLWASTFTIVAYVTLKIRDREIAGPLAVLAGVFGLTVIGQFTYAVLGTLFGQGIIGPPRLHLASARASALQRDPRVPGLLAHEGRDPASRTDVGNMIGTWRLAGVGLVMAVMLGGLGLRLWAIQVTETEDYTAEAERNLVRVVATPAPRGDIYDRNGELLAGTKASLAVVVDMALVEDDFAEELAQRLAAFLDEPASEILERFESANSGAQLILAKDLTEQQALTLVEHREDFPGVAVIPQPVRDYPNAELAAQVLGYIGKPSSRRPRTAGCEGHRRRWEGRCRALLRRPTSRNRRCDQVPG